MWFFRGFLSLAPDRVTTALHAPTKNISNPARLSIIKSLECEKSKKSTSVKNPIEEDNSLDNAPIFMYNTSKCSFCHVDD